jgi:DNA repair exonuclease SbcCD ATPase subunit
MIRRVVLTNWRAYDRLRLDFQEGVTFLVAANGIGKSSVVMAVAWGVLGQASGVDGAASIRGDAESASVEVRLELPDGRILEITRVVTNNGKVETQSSIDGDPIGEELELLQEAFGADAGVLARLSFMSEGGHIASEKEFDLKDHLFQVFGVSGLREAAAQAERLVAAAQDERTRIRTVKRQHAGNQHQLEQALKQVEDELGAFEERGREISKRLDEAGKARSAAEQWAAYQQSLQRREAQIGDALKRVGGIVDVKDPDAALTKLADLEDQLDRQVDQLRDEIASRDARWSLALKAIERLEGGGAICPTCLRPMSREDASRAFHEHEKSASSMEQALSELNTALGDLTDRVSTIRDVVRGLQGIPGPPDPPPAMSVDLDSATRRYSDVMAKLEAHKDSVAELKARRRQLVNQLRDHEEAEAAEAAERLAFRREAVARATALALQETAERLTRERIDPLTQEVAWRWKRLFGTGDLILNPNGTIRRKVGARELKLSELSGGERIWAQLVTRLLVLTASTRAPFVWLDEPLEHLDPTLRTIVAATLVRASSAGLRQIVVTTYEDALAHQLAEDDNRAQLVLIRSGDAPQ